MTKKREWRPCDGRRLVGWWRGWKGRGSGERLEGSHDIEIITRRDLACRDHTTTLRPLEKRLKKMVPFVISYMKASVLAPETPRG